MIVCSDIHAHKYRAFNQDNRRLNNIISLIEDLYDAADGDDGYVLFCGDLFNNMQLIHTEVIDRVTEVFQKCTKKHPKVKWIMISGNHDYATKNFIEKPAISAVNALARVSDNVLVIDNGRYSGDDFVVHGVSYYDNPEHFKLALADVSKAAAKGQSGKSHYLLMHQTVGFADLVPDDIDPRDPLFDPFDLVFNGHIHAHSVVNAKFINVGSPLHRDAGDIGKEKGVLLLDAKSGKFVRIVLDYPVYRKLDEGEEIPEEWKDDYIVWMPKQIEVTIEEQEIAEKFDHNRVSRDELLSNYIKLKLDPENPKQAKRIISYGKKLLSHVTI